MRPWLWRGLIVLAVFAACAAGAALHWRNGNIMPATDDILLYMVLLPLVLLGALWSAGKLASMLAAPPATPASADAAAPVAPVPADIPAAPLALLAGALLLPQGASADQVRDAHAEGTARPGLDPSLTDDYGFPLMSARVADLDVDTTENDIRTWLRQQGLPDPQFREGHWRALALGGAVLAELAQAATLHQQLEPHTQAEPAQRAAVGLPTLQLLPLFPSTWDTAQRLAAGRWLLHQITLQGWPADRLTMSMVAERQVAGPHASLAQVALQCTRAGLPCLAIVLACASHVDQQTADLWSSQDQLFSARNQRGLVPGEGAAGLLVADAQQAALFDAAALPWLHGAADGVRSSSIDASARGDADLLAALTAAALLTAASDASQIALLTTDGGDMGKRASEALALAHAALPHMDTASQWIGVAAGCGEAGPVPTVAALVLARQACADQQSHVLSISQHDPLRRSAAVIRPAAAAA